MSAYNEEFICHDAFEAVLRAHGHPAAVADLDSLQRGGQSWKLFLEALGLTCRDDATLWQGFANGIHLLGYTDDYGIYPPKRVEKKSPTPRPGSVNASLISRAMLELGGPTASTLFSNETLERLGASLGAYGRPIPPKDDLLLRERLVREELSPGGVEPIAIMRHTSSGARKKTPSLVGDDFANKYKKIDVSDLKSYEQNRGRYIEGVLLTDPFTPIIGTTTVLEDCNGDAVVLALYNLLPDGLHGDDSIPLASKFIPKRCTVCIVEPFLKVFRDGSRGLRIDDPSDIIVLSRDDRAENEEEALSNAKMLGNKFVWKKMYLSAYEAYLAGLRQADLASTLLLNRSKALAMIGNWTDSLADAASSLTLQPKNTEAWSQYKISLEFVSKKIKSQGKKHKQCVERQILHDVLAAEATDCSKKVVVQWTDKSSME